jgi:two-component system, cell cycle sensor histidine kinase and response regulator CckA
VPRDVILCVDDEPIILRLCSIAAAEGGFRVAVAENGAAGYEAFLRLRDDVCLVLADVVMAGKLNGIEMAQKILELDPAMKILMMSGYTDEIINLEGKNKLPLIRKPFLAQELLKRIRFLLGMADSAATR